MKFNINTTIKTTSDCDGDARSVGGGRGWLAGDTDGLAGWPVTVGVVSQPGADAERYGCAWLGVVPGISAALTGGVLVKLKMTIPVETTTKQRF